MGLRGAFVLEQSRGKMVRSIRSSATGYFRYLCLLSLRPTQLYFLCIFFMAISFFLHCAPFLYFLCIYVAQEHCFYVLPLVCVFCLCVWDIDLLCCVDTVNLTDRYHNWYDKIIFFESNLFINLHRHLSVI